LPCGASLDQFGDASLPTSGQSQNETQLDSSNGTETSGFTQLFGIFTTLMWVPGSNGHCKNFQAYWLASPDIRDDPLQLAPTWPTGAEHDMVECLGGVLRPAYHPDNGNGTVGTFAGSSIALTGWVFVTGVWEYDTSINPQTGLPRNEVYIADYYCTPPNGTQVTCHHLLDHEFKSANDHTPLELIMDNAGSGSGVTNALFAREQVFTWSGN
jgi:hypothetical protein